MKFLIFFISLSLFTSIYSGKKINVKSSDPSVKTKEVTYSSDGTNLKGFLAYDQNKTGKRPGIIVVHEWWGLNNYAKERAEMLAKLGYVALAVDMYGNGKTTEDAAAAGKFSSEVMQHMDTAAARFYAGLKELKNQPQTDTNKIAAIGYCFGGGIVLRMALQGANLDGVASFHGDLPTEPVKNPKEVKANILVLNGAADPFNPKEKVEKFKNVMDSAGIKYKFINYPGAKHSFTNPAADSLGKKLNLPLAYNKKADKESWQAMKDFFKRIFKK
jgi:dienelactone hydrolase